MTIPLEDLWFDSSSLNTRVYVRDFADLSPRHRRALAAETNVEMRKANEIFDATQKRLDETGELPMNTTERNWKALKRHRYCLRRYVGVLATYAAGDKMLIREENIAMDKARQLPPDQRLALAEIQARKAEDRNKVFLATFLEMCLDTFPRVKVKELLQKTEEQLETTLNTSMDTTS